MFSVLLQGAFTAPSQLHGFLVSWALLAWSCSLRYACCFLPPAHVGMNHAGETILISLRSSPFLRARSQKHPV
jgi:hypothetical protein